MNNLIASCLVALTGFGIATVLSFALVRWRVCNWLADDCREEGPDSIKKQLSGKLIRFIVIGILIGLALVALDALVLAPQGYLAEIMRTFSPNWPTGTVTLGLWIGAFAGMLGGCAAGEARAVCITPKCKHIYPRLMPIFGMKSGS
jgi:hypothetical protein